MTRKLFFIGFMLFANLLFAQQTKKTWTLREIIDYAISNNLTIKRSTYNVQSGEINLLQSKMAMLPNLNFNGNYGINWGRTIDPTTNIFTENEIRNSNLGATSTWLLWNGFRLFYNLKQSDIELDAANEDLIKARNDVILNVITLYLNVVFNKELYNVAQLQLNTTQEQLQRTRKLADAGSVPLADVLNLDAQLATNEVNVIQQENALNLSLLQLKQALQLPASTPMDVELPQVDISNELLINKTADEIYDIATLSMPEIRAAELRKTSSQYAWRSAKGNLYPRISVNASYNTVYSDQRRQFYPDGNFQILTEEIGYVDGSNATVFRDVTVPTGQISVPSIGDQYRDNRGRSVGVNLQIPIFNGLSARSAMQRAAISRNVADISYLEISNTLRQAVETAYNNALAAGKTYASTERQVKARDEAYRMAKQRYSLGAVNFVDYQLAENNLFQSQSDLLRAKYDFIFRKKVLDFYQGLPLDF
ncbi:MAG: TolC family protein [Cyclobacteriaceae bacterium]|nr:TolC family protein [Cyclobacteriaceae bacterium]